MHQHVRKAVVGIVTAAGMIAAMAGPVDAAAASGSARIPSPPPATRHAVTPATPAAFHLRNANSGRCLAVDSHDGVWLSGARIVQYDCLNVTDQTWHFSACFSDGHPTEWCHLVNGNDYCLAVPGGSTGTGVQLIQWNCGNFDDHYWRTDTIDASTFHLINYHSGQVVDVLGGNVDNWTPVVQWPSSGSPGVASQQWYFA